jgi:hypothetical protein
MRTYTMKLLAISLLAVWSMFGQAAQPGGGSGGGGAGTIGTVASSGASIVVTNPTGPTTNLEVNSAQFAALSGNNSLVGNNKVNTTYLSTTYYPNCATTGTTVNTFAVLTVQSGTLCAIKAATTSTTGIIGFVASGAGTTGNPTIVMQGFITVPFDAAVTQGDWVVASTITAGDAADAGASRPTSSVQILGYANATLGNAGNAAMWLAPPDDVGLGVTLTGTANQITLTGTCSGSPISCTFSLPSGLIFPGTIDFPASTGGKINLYNGSNYGVGVQGNLLQLYSPFSSTRTGIGYGNSGAFTEVFSVLGTGVKVLATPTAPACAAAGDLGSVWIDNTSSVTTHVKFCVNVSSTPTWVAVI